MSYRLTWTSTACEATVVIPMPLPSLANLQTRHGNFWKVRGIASSQKDVVHKVCLTGERPPTPCTVTLTRISPRKLDRDNWVSSAKFIQDTVARWIGNVWDEKKPAPDGPSSGIDFEHTQESPPPMTRVYKQALRITVRWDG